MMNQRLLSIALAGVSLLALCGCPHNDEEPTQPIGFRAPVRTRPLPTPSTNLPPEMAAEPTPRERRAPAEPSAPAEQKPADYPYGVPVPGKPELVTSPYAPDSGYVNIQGYAPGQEVRCPYTQKIFLVP